MNQNRERHQLWIVERLTQFYSTIPKRKLNMMLKFNEVCWLYVLLRHTRLIELIATSQLWNLKKKTPNKKLNLDFLFWKLTSLDDNDDTNHTTLIALHLFFYNFSILFGPIVVQPEKKFNFPWVSKVAYDLIRALSLPWVQSLSKPR